MRFPFTFSAFYWLFWIDCVKLKYQLGFVQLGFVQLGFVQLGFVQLGFVQLGFVQLGGVTDGVNGALKKSGLSSSLGSIRGTY